MRNLIVGILLVLGTSPVYAQTATQTQSPQKPRKAKAPEIDLTTVVTAMAVLGGTVLVIRGRRKRNSQ
jgi:hypothetical protein